MADAKTVVPVTVEHEIPSIASDLAEQFKQFHAFEVHETIGVAVAPYAVVPEGKKIESLKPLLDSYRAVPDRRRGKSTARDVASFVAIVNRFKNDQTAVFANPDRGGPSFTSVFDWHPAGPDTTKAENLAHRSIYAPQLSDEWKAWTGRNGASMSQADFAAFIEEHVTDLIVPALDDPTLKTFADLVEGVWATPSQMVALSRSLQINVESVVKNAQTLNSGEVSIIFEEIHRDGAGAPLKVPTLFTIAVPVFYAGELYRIAARLRYRVAGGKITWSYQLVRPDLVFDDAFKGIVKAVTEETGVPVLLGAPEQ